MMLFQEAFDMYQMFHTRHSLHRKAYQHKAVQAVDIMLVYDSFGGWKDGSC